ncbi:peptidase E [Bacillus sp. BHET2]|uniref:Type 1 glutamine amidotransferase-like domain-containing protein n=1 Tax=Bacillus sp. BHET2 TaxID=2583818 RepID=UPI00110E59ED|nr:Type 1 glutamine amidotransferase-like domain-containing protein [Bacillus sp. BHET2]TMU87587.1 peptidase E [Bacillus sp. BHET2]
MGMLFLSGGGDRDQSIEIDKQFAAEVNKGKPILYVPVAMDQEHISYEACYEWIKDVFSPFGIKDISMWTELSGKTIEDLLEYSAVYIGGGNTFRLMNDLLRSNFYSLVKMYMNEGGIVYGGSAGAIIMGTSILTCTHMDVNLVRLESYCGLSMVYDYSIWCHYEEGNDSMIHTFIENNRRPVIALPEETGVKVKNGMIVVSGKKGAYVFNGQNKKQVNSGERIFNLDTNGSRD